MEKLRPRSFLGENMTWFLKGCLLYNDQINNKVTFYKLKNENWKGEKYTKIKRNLIFELKWWCRHKKHLLKWALDMYKYRDILGKKIQNWVKKKN